MQRVSKVLLLLLIIISACNTSDSIPEIEPTSPIAFINLVPDQGRLNFIIDNVPKAMDIAFKQNSLFHNSPIGNKVVEVTNEEGRIILTQTMEFKDGHRYYLYLLKDTKGAYYLGSGERKGRYSSNSDDSKANYYGVDLLQTSQNLPFHSIAILNKSISSLHPTRTDTDMFVWFENITPNLQESFTTATAFCGSNPISNELIFWNAEDKNKLNSKSVFPSQLHPNELILPSFPSRINLGAINTLRIDFLLIIFDDPNQPKGYDGIAINWDTVQFKD